MSISIRGRAIGGSVQALIIGKSLNPSKLPYLDHYGLVEIKKNCSRNYNFWNTSNTSLGNLGFKIIQGRLLIENLKYLKDFILEFIFTHWQWILATL